jgi:hypothetical protein
MRAEETTKVIALTRNLRITGEISLIPGGRLTDFMNKANQFIVITNAKVTSFEGEEITSGAFLNLNLNMVEVIMPEE